MTINDLKCEYFKKETGLNGSLQYLKYHYFKQKLGI
ncbi:hypothetical protein VP468E531_P0017 [Vibrio phage 468E53-1]|nr:hypothetical protein VP468E531_P0017 [Vibrio phage 468E53-1]